MSDTLTFAVLVDGENFQAARYSDVLSEVEAAGNIAIKWVYADWTSPNQKSWQEVVFNTASAVKQQFHNGRDSADHALIMDTIELISTNSRINAICLVTSDGGFAGLAQRIREKGLHVMGIGEQKTPERLRNACHNFTFIENLGGESETLQVSGCDDLDYQLLRAFSLCSKNGEHVYLGEFGSAIKKVNSSFDQRNYGHKSLKTLIREKSRYLEIIGTKSDRCFVRQKVMKGTIKVAPGNKNFTFIVAGDQDFYVHEREMVKPGAWARLRENLEVKFSVSELHADSDAAPVACNVAL